MKKTLLTFISIIAFTVTVSAQNVNIPDANFKAMLLANTLINYDVDKSEISVAEASGFRGTISVPGEIDSITGIEAFTKLTTLYLEGKQWNPKRYDISKNIGLKHLTIGDGVEVDISKNVSLLSLRLEGTLFDTIDLSNNLLLNSFSCMMTNLKSLDFSKNTAIKTIDCSMRNWFLDTITFGDNVNLTHLAIAGTGSELKNLDISKCIALDTFYCGIDKLIRLNTNNNLKFLQIYSDSLATLDLSNNYELLHLRCSSKKFTKLTLGAIQKISKLDFQGSSLANLDVSKQVNLIELDFLGNPITNIDLTQNILLTTLSCGNLLSSINLNKNINLTRFDISGPNYNLTQLDFSNNLLLNHFGCYQMYNLSQINLTKNSQLEKLYCMQNINLQDLDVSNNLKINTFYCTENQTLETICVSPLQNKSSWTKDSYISYSTNCKTITNLIENETSLPKTIQTIYNLQGQQVNTAYQGIVIIRYTDGTSEKVIQ